MNVFRNTKILKKFILVIIVIILFSFAIPKQVSATKGNSTWDIKGHISDFIFWIERGIIRVANNIFCDERHQYQYVKADQASSDENSTTVYLSPETIIKGKFAILNPNIFEDISETELKGDPASDEYYDTYTGNTDDSKGDKALNLMVKGRNELRNTIAGWYYALRNLALIALLSILVYVGIRMIISTVSQDKAKYKIMLKDWLVALCLVVVMHYIMIGTLNITSSIVDAIGTSGENSNSMQDIMTKIQKINESNEEEHEIWLDENNEPASEDTGELYTIGDAFAYELVLLGIIGYTLIFAIKYLLRMMTIVFLILIAPVTAITYPIDKISDGKAQAFNTWLQEFIYEVIIQPFHLLIYIVLIGSATALADTNVIYSIMCFAVMIPAEKFIKQMFGFKDKLGSPIGAFASGAAVSQLMNKAFSGGSSKVDRSPKVEGKSETDDSFRENKRKTGLVDADSGTGEPIEYSSDDPDSGDTVSDTPNSGGTGEDTTYSDYTGSGVQVSSSYDTSNDVQDTSSDDPDSDTGSDVQDASSDDQSSDDADSNNPNSPVSSSAETDSADQDTEETSNPKTESIYNPGPKKISKFKNALSTFRENSDKKRLAKYGTTNIFGATGKYILRKGAKFGKKAIKGATTLTGAAALGLAGTMFGQGKAGLAAGATLGATIGNSVNNKLTSGANWIRENARETAYAVKDEDKRRKAKVKKMMKTQGQYENASKEFSKRNNGRTATRKELKKELEERARFKEAGLSDSEIDDAMEFYHDDIHKWGEEKAFDMAYNGVREGSIHKATDFEEPKKVQYMYDKIMKQYQDLGVNQDLAEENTRAIIERAALTHKIKKPALPPTTRKDAFKADEKNKSGARATCAKRHNGKQPTKKQLDHELEMGYNLRRAGISEKEREEFFNKYLIDQKARKEAQTSLGIAKDAKLTEEQEMMVDDELERRFEIKIKARISDEGELTSYIVEAQKNIRQNSGIVNPSNGQIFVEVKHMLTVRDSYHIGDLKIDEQSKIKKISEIRESETRFVEGAKDKEGARAVITAQRREAKRAIERGDKPEKPEARVTKAKFERDFLARHSSEEMRSKKDMDKAAKKMLKDLKSLGLQDTEEHKIEVVEDIINSGRKKAGIEGVEEYRYKSD